MVGLPSKEEMECIHLDAVSQRLMYALSDDPEATPEVVAIRVSKTGKTILLTKKEYEELWQNQK